MHGMATGPWPMVGAADCLRHDVHQIRWTVRGTQYAHPHRFSFIPAACSRLARPGTWQGKTESSHPTQPVQRKTNTAAPGTSASLEHAADAIRKGIVTSLSSLDTIESDIVDLVRKTVSDTLRTSAAAGTDSVHVVSHVVMAAIEAAEQVGTGLTMSIKSVAKGAIMGVHDVGGDAVAASFEIMRSVIRHGAAVGADIGGVTRRAVDGLVEATAETGGDVAGIGRKAVQGAIEEAGNISNLTVKTVKEVLIGLAGSVGETLQAATPQAALHPGSLLHKADTGGKRQHHS